ncbi:BON domain-containing protein [Methyloversatilis sp. MC4-4]|uniref:BON domain-containing protein n=1 Tax=Methyloversatilis sp. MC4-4 TaxID=3132824 RepID=UPI003CFA6B59
MITRQSIATLLTTTAIAYSICSPAQAASLVAATQATLRDPVTDDRDRGLQEAIKGALGGDEALRGCYVAVSARDGRVTLSGVVRDASQLARTLQTAMAVPGVRAVDNALEVAGR